MAQAISRDREALGEYADEGYYLKEYGDHDVTVCFKEKELATFSQVATTREALQAVCKRHKDSLNGNSDPGEILHCRNCAHWQNTQYLRGNCGKHPWEKDKKVYGSDATPCSIGCEDYVDKQTMTFVKEG